MPISSSNLALRFPLCCMVQTLQPSPALYLCLNQPSPSPSYSCTPVWYASQDRETPLPIYLGIMINTKTHQRAHVDMLFDLAMGLCISYALVLDISTELGNKIWKAVCPPLHKGGLFTTAAVDNIDHNPRSTSAHDSFHGTGISLFQHPDDSFTGVQWNAKTDNTQRGPKEKAAQIAPALIHKEWLFPVLLALHLIADTWWKSGGVL